jgi:hypothetical protein
MNHTHAEKSKFMLAVLLMAAAAMSRFIPHAANFTAVGAMALFGGAIFRDKRIAFLLPMVVMLLTDAVLGFHLSMIPVYACFTATVFVGTRISYRLNPFSIITSSIACSILFFLVTNLPFWYADLSLYPLTWNGTIESYTAAIPFFGNLLAGDLFYNGILFGTYFLVTRKLPAFAG